MTNEEIIQLVKSTIDTSIGGQMSEQQLQSFIETVVKRSTFLSEIRIESGIYKSLKLSTLGMEARAMRKAVEGAAADGVSIAIGERELIPVEVILPVAVTYSFLRKSIGGMPNLNPDATPVVLGQIQNAIANQFANDMVDIAWNGDHTSADAFLKIMDGYLKLIKADTNTSKDTFGSTDKMIDIFDGMLGDLPVEYQNRVNDLKYYLSPAMERKYRRELSEKNTALGDLMTIKNDKAYFQGVQLEPVFAIPDTEICLTLSQNLAVGFGQEMLVERQKEITRRVVNIVTTSDVGVNYAISKAVVLYTKGV